MILKGQVEIIEFMCRIVDGNYSNVMRRESIVRQAHYDLVTVHITANREIRGIALDCREVLKKYGVPIYA